MEMNRRRAWGSFVVAFSLAALWASPAWGIAEGGGKPWSVVTKVGPDALVGGWFVNLGITGARAKLTAKHPKALEVAYVFKGTPAYGKLAVGDMIVGANGGGFTTAHKHGYGMDKFGGEGPLMDFGNALELSQGSPRLKGKLTLGVIRKGKRETIELKIPTRYGAFSRTYPSNCPKSDLILREAYAYLLKRQRADGSWSGRPHINAFAALALLASGEKKHMPAVWRAMVYFAKTTNDRIDYGGLDCWKYGLYGVCLAEYHLATGDKRVLRDLEEVNRWLIKAQFDNPYRKGRGAGGWGHRPKDRPGGNGYGPICMITAQAMAAWSLMAQCGIEIDRKRFNLAHEFLAKGTNNIGYVWYADGNGGNNKYADMGRTGGSAVAHAVCPFGGKAFRDFALRNARCIGTNYKTFPDTHGSPILGMGWTALGAAIDPGSFRNLMNRHKWWFNLAHCPDGTFIYQPNRDNNPQDYTGAPRLSATAAVALIFSIKHKRLRMMGARQRGLEIDPGLLSSRTRAPYAAIARKRYASAYRTLVALQTNAVLSPKDKQIVERMKSHVLKRVKSALDEIRRLNRAGDVVKVQSKIAQTHPLFEGIDRYDEAVSPISRSLRQEPGRTEVRLGKQFEMILATADRTRDDTDISALDKFAADHPKSLYGKAARAAAAVLRAEDTNQNPRDAYFSKLMKETETQPSTP